MSHIFVSYSKQDIDFADHLRNLLKNEGFDVWMDETDLMPSEEWWPTIEQNIDNCAAFIVIMSPRAKKSRWVTREILHAEEMDKQIFPVLLEGERWPQLADVQYEDMQAGTDATLPSRLVQMLGNIVPHHDPTPVPEEPFLMTRQRPVWATMVGAVIALIIVVVIVIAFGTDLLAGDDDTPLDSAHMLATVIAQQATETAQAWTTTPTPDMTHTLAAMTAAAYTQTALATTTTPNSIPTMASMPSLSPVESTVESGIREERVIGKVAFVKVLGGCFMMGSNDPEADDDEQPVHDVCLSEFWISKTEVTNEQYQACVDAGGCSLPGSITYYADAAYASYPVIYVDWYQASDYATWLTNTVGEDIRLPTEAQWEYAAAGPEDNKYPWGHKTPTCEQVNYNRCPDGILPVANTPTDASWVGAMDMGGNVSEWTADWYSDDYYGDVSPDTWDPAGPSSGSTRVVRGGASNLPRNYTRTAYRSEGTLTQGFDSLGFRIVIIP